MYNAPTGNTTKKGKKERKEKKKKCAGSRERRNSFPVVSRWPSLPGLHADGSRHHGAPSVQCRVSWAASCNRRIIAPAGLLACCERKGPHTTRSDAPAPCMVARRRDTSCACPWDERTPIPRFRAAGQADGHQQGRPPRMPPPACTSPCTVCCVQYVGLRPALESGLKAADACMQPSATPPDTHSDTDRPSPASTSPPGTIGTIGTATSTSGRGGPPGFGFLSSISNSQAWRSEGQAWSGLAEAVSCRRPRAVRGPAGTTIRADEGGPAVQNPGPELIEALGLAGEHRRVEAAAAAGAGNTLAGWVGRSWRIIDASVLRRIRARRVPSTPLMAPPRRWCVPADRRYCVNCVCTLCDLVPHSVCAGSRSHGRCSDFCVPREHHPC
jgi:hypothetical protein